ncbi:hypothetical protein VIGAN_11052800, partial [Vigna angularis var. angularis]
HDCITRILSRQYLCRHPSTYILVTSKLFDSCYRDASFVKIIMHLVGCNVLHMGAGPLGWIVRRITVDQDRENDVIFHVLIVGFTKSSESRCPKILGRAPLISNSSKKTLKFFQPQW